MFDEALVVGRGVPDARRTLGLLEPNSAREPIATSLESCVPGMDNATLPGPEETDPMISLTHDARSKVDNGCELYMHNQAQDDCVATRMEHISCEGDQAEGEQVEETNEESEEDEDRMYHTKYELRPQTHNNEAGCMSTWYDKDETGDYDPVEERRRLNKRNPKRKQQAKAQVPALFDSCAEGPHEDYVSAPITPKLVVELNFTNKQKFRNKLEEIAQPTDLEIEHDFGSRRLRRREVQNTLGDHCTSTQADLQDQHTWLKHFEGHPAARGCRQCLELGEWCPLLDDERGWPCKKCTSQTTECELIIAPTYKAPCEKCTKRKVICSYTVTLDHSGPCINCAVHEESCVAGPLRDLLRPRINCDGSIHPATIAAPCDNGLDAAVLPKQKVFTPELIYTCKRCDEAGRQCSFTLSTEEDECISCQMGGHICLKKLFTGYTKKPAKTKKPAQTQNVDNQLASRNRPEGVTKRRASASACPSPSTKIRKLTPVSSSAPEHKAKQIITKPTPTINPAPEHKVKQITTKLSHPVSFNYNVANMSITKSRPCHFCSSIHFAYPLLGIGQSRAIDVYDDPNKAGLIELKPSPYERTRMCLSCTTDRLSIIKCTSHRLLPIPGIQVTTLDFAGAFSNLFRPPYQISTTRRDRWCSLCPNLAIRECVKQIGVAGHLTKCGLALCLTCVAEFKSTRPPGDLETMLAGLREEPSERRPLGLRADWAMLKMDGLLVRFIAREMKSQEDENAKAGH